MIKLFGATLVIITAFTAPAWAQTTAPYVNTLQIEVQERALNKAAKNAVADIQQEKNKEKQNNRSLKKNEKLKKSTQ